MTIFKNIMLFLMLTLANVNVYAQEKKVTNFYDEIKNYDLSKVLTADSILTEDMEDAKDKIGRAEILGFIGENFQRFYIHFISIIQNPTNPYEYLAYGKTMVKETICSFQGKIVVRESTMRLSDDMPGYKEGTAVCEVILYEDKKLASTGSIQGKLTSNFIIDNKGEFRYDALMFVADGFANNQFIGGWRSYKTRILKKCNWGDYRIPDCGDLDSGTGEFMVSDKYVKNGWLSYMLENKMSNLMIKEQSADANNGTNSPWWK